MNPKWDIQALNPPLQSSASDHREDSPNSGCLIDIGKGRKAAHYCIVRPRAAKRSINLYWD